MWQLMVLFATGIARMAIYVILSHLVGHQTGHATGPAAADHPRELQTTDNDDDR